MKPTILTLRLAGEMVHIKVASAGRKESMRTFIVLILTLSAIAILPLNGQEKPTIIVHPFTTAEGVSWPYEMRQMVAQTVAELQHKDGKKFDVNSEVPASHAHVYTLD